MTHPLRTTITALSLAGVMVLGAGACGGDDSSDEATIRDAAGGDGITVDLDGDKGSLSIGGGALPEGFPSEMPIFDEDLMPLTAASIEDEDDGEQRFAVSWQPDATEAELLEFYRRELPANGWTIDTSDEQSGDGGQEAFAGVLVIEGHGFTGGITILGSGGTMNLSISLARPLD